MKKWLILILFFFLLTSKPNLALAGSCKCTGTEFSESSLKDELKEQCSPDISSDTDCQKIKTDADKKAEYIPTQQTWDQCIFYTSNNCGAVQEDAKPSILDDLQTKFPGFGEKPILEVNIPGLNFSDVVSTTDGTGTYFYIAWIPELISALYKFLLAIVSIVAVVMIIIQGIKVASGGFISKTVKENGKDVVISAYKNIGRAIVGLMIAWGSYAILYNINPALVQFNALKVKVVEGVPLEILFPLNPDEHPEPTEENGLLLPPTGGIYKFVQISPSKDANCTITHGMKVAEHIKPIIIAAARQLYNETTYSVFGGPYKLRGGGFRELGKIGDGKSTNKDDLSTQVGGWESKCGINNICGNVCNPFGTRANWLAQKAPDPRNCPHTTGAALDVYCESKTYKLKNGTMITTGAKTVYVPCQLKFEEIMKRNGFCRLQHEIWHYELPPFTKGCDDNWTGMWKKWNFSMDYSSCNGIFEYGSNGLSGKCLGEVDTTFQPINPKTNGTPKCPK